MYKHLSYFYLIVILSNIFYIYYIIYINIIYNGIDHNFFLIVILCNLLHFIFASIIFLFNSNPV